VTNGLWPDGARAAIPLTIDNMGEASELYRGTWPEDKTIGLHRAVTHHLPRVLQILERHGVSATYFIEAWNTGHYPGAINAVRNAGHEVAFHGWQHEPWSGLDPETERGLFEKSIFAFGKLYLMMRGFRPPGGVLTELTPTLLHEYGFSYYSPAADEAAITDGLACLPFRWTGIDAYYYSDAFGGLRLAKGDQETPMEPALVQQRKEELIEDRIDNGGYTALLFHPFLQTTDERLAVVESVVKRLAEDQRIWCARCDEVANWVLSHPESFGNDPGFDNTTWSR
jgi:peptidoglycan/xylan/chitin deacetylase (PgdA/CDA1 family)